MDKSSDKSLIAMTGASGFVGGALLRLLLAEGHKVVALGRRPPLATGAVTWHGCDLAVALPHSEALAGCAAVAHLAAWAHRRAPTRVNEMALLRRINIDAPVALLKSAAQAGVPRFVFVSSSAVYGTARTDPLTEQAELRPQGLYGETKLEAEQRLTEAAANCSIGLTILRPSAVLGVGAPGSSRQLFRAAALGLPLPAALLRNRRSFVAVDDVAAALRLALTQGDGRGVFNVADPQPLSTGALLQRAAEALGRRARLWPYPSFPLRAALSLLGRRSIGDSLFADLVLDSNLLQRHLGWSIQQSLTDTIAAAAIAWAD